MSAATTPAEFVRSLNPEQRDALEAATDVFAALNKLPSDGLRARVLLAAIAVYSREAFGEKQMGALLELARRR